MNSGIVLLICSVIYALGISFVLGLTDGDILSKVYAIFWPLVSVCYMIALPFILIHSFGLYIHDHLR